MALVITNTPMITLEDRVNTDMDAMIEAGWVERVCGAFPTPETIACLDAGQTDEQELQNGSD